MFVKFLKKGYKDSRPLLDYLVSIMGLLLLTPLFIVVGIVTKLTSEGPVFYTQERVGKGGRLFEIIKFRTMYTDAELKTGPIWAGRDDPRITPFGRFLRKTHIDELPQLINVIMGEMSIIGPRPERPFFVKEFKENIHGYTKRLAVKPGITGLAQCYHKYDETIQDVQIKLNYDVLYIKKMCMLLDLKILLLTVKVSVLGEVTPEPVKLHLSERQERVVLATAA
ncbi:MAG: sugar transferase [Candidatus Scalindua sp. AMX11]|nr:MAG: sugar transferase [Candidatus Scalindua sp.]NOG85721.1 sugar transferase [Planctomycetota bacterium]RZV73169.1 MAG: sugar transferase [Candidatus Scalindua sp. SCAELEC01]TDE64742.1 MAG: sugar transferase [Candidatus Scalindua sp. AMX11]GJQ58695.1 MAG: capsular polysaccharide biosynthesis protein [Candidatus Scalindua sp.]